MNKIKQKKLDRHEKIIYLAYTPAMAFIDTIFENVFPRDYIDNKN